MSTGIKCCPELPAPCCFHHVGVERLLPCPLSFGAIRPILLAGSRQLDVYGQLKPPCTTGHIMEPSLIHHVGVQGWRLHAVLLALLVGRHEDGVRHGRAYRPGHATGKQRGPPPLPCTCKAHSMVALWRQGICLHFVASLPRSNNHRPTIRTPSNLRGRGVPQMRSGSLACFVGKSGHCTLIIPAFPKPGTLYIPRGRQKTTALPIG